MGHPRYELADSAHLTEEAWTQREAELRGEVRSATRTLMQQQLVLLREQRLGEAGELCAQIAHDLRNPLAGILAAVTNLQREAANEEDRERLGTIRAEVKRVSRHLDGLVDATRQCGGDLCNSRGSQPDGRRAGASKRDLQR